MKLSLSWIFDHIYADYTQIDIKQFVDNFIKTTAEIEGYEKYHISLEQFAVGVVTKIDQDTMSLHVQEWNAHHVLPKVADCHVGSCYLLINDGRHVRLATAVDCGSGKESSLPAFDVASSEQDGSWKKTIQNHDYLIHLDNKSVNHRPDLWGHRGIAREVAAMFGLPLKPLSVITAPLAVQVHQKSAPASKENPFSLAIENPRQCQRISAVYAQTKAGQASPIALAFRLLKVDARPINAVVDLTNYVMLDMGHPMHAFDADAISSGAIIARQAKAKEELQLLDEQTVHLTQDDCVITNGLEPISLAGISGGLNTGVTKSSTNLILESGCFDAATIRRTAARLKRRTESSARFEKSLDPQQTAIALQRFIFVAKEIGLEIKTAPAIISVGNQGAPLVITITHEFLERVIGTTITPDFVVKTLHALEFGVVQDGTHYTITIPSFRSTKDVTHGYDIAEEILRFLGYENIPLVLPQRVMKPFDLTSVERVRYIKRNLAFSSLMHELYTYSFFDESFLRVLKWEPHNTLKVQSAVSENWQRLVTSLVPNLLKAVQQESARQDHVRFFEWARTWNVQEAVEEKKSLAGIIADRKKPVNFYDGKQCIEQLLQMLGLSVEWVKVDNPTDPWYAPFQTAQLVYHNRIIGIAGKAHPKFYESVTLGDAFIFELDADFLLQYKPEQRAIAPLAKYPLVERDISMLVPLFSTVSDIKKIIAGADAKIISVQLIDFFEKPEWDNQKSLTFRFIVSDPEKTLTHQEADQAWERVSAAIKEVGGIIR
ncbi:phenylalanine--tRNA ligase beta subunit [Candidatus Dependentiae bacterium Noda2021]|nr:phenylalanine--tRNA ligase beta subunit [Candidatus Dependentiae bacterium Noda2021]